MRLKLLVQSIANKLGYQISKYRDQNSMHGLGNILNLPILDFETTFLDIGASYGLAPKWEVFAYNENFNLIQVEPDLIQAEEIKKRYPKSQVITKGLGNKNSKAKINVTYAQGCSSVLEPDEETLSRFPVKKWFEVLRQVEVEIYKFCDLADNLNLQIPDFIKIDVQGYEYEVLEGFDRYLDKLLCIELETHLTPLYKNQKTLTEINHFLTEKGFMLRHLETVGPFEGEVIEFDAYFIKRPEFLKTELERKKVKFWEEVNGIPKAYSFKDVDTF